MIYISQRDQLRKLKQENEALTAKASEMELAANIAFVLMAEAGNIDETTVVEHAAIFSSWGPEINYKVGNLRKYGYSLYKCLQNHTSVENETPDKQAAYWLELGSIMEEYPLWSQPITDNDAYDLYDTVTYNSKHWKSSCYKNIWTPGVRGWDEVE